MQIIWRKHVQIRMMERMISREAILTTLRQGEIIKEYPDDTPCPSRLLLHWVNGQPLHVVAATCQETTIIITAYYPDPAMWDSDFRRKRK